jgi:hypothetical protein
MAIAPHEVICSEDKTHTPDLQLVGGEQISLPGQDFNRAVVAYMQHLNAERFPTYYRDEDGFARRTGTDALLVLDQELPVAEV